MRQSLLTRGADPPVPARYTWVSQYSTLNIPHLFRLLIPNVGSIGTTVHPIDSMVPICFDSHLFPKAESQILTLLHLSGVGGVSELRRYHLRGTHSETSASTVG